MIKKIRLNFGWLENFDKIFFDLDGLLVNTEKLHYRAYCQTFIDRGYKLKWNFSTYCQKALIDNSSLSNAIFKSFPSFHGDISLWNEIKYEKTQKYLNMLQCEKINFLPGVERLLKDIKAKGTECCVVTNSSESETILIKKSLPLLNVIPHWITREHYEKPKPNPDGYLTAKKLISCKDSDRIIGFEDSYRGVTALKNAKIFNILICPLPYIERSILELVKDFHFESFNDFSNKFEF